MVAFFNTQSSITEHCFTQNNSQQAHVKEKREKEKLKCPASCNSNYEKLWWGKLYFCDKFVLWLSRQFPPLTIVFDDRCRTVMLNHELWPSRTNSFSRVYQQRHTIHYDENSQWRFTYDTWPNFPREKREKRIYPSVAKIWRIVYQSFCTRLHNPSLSLFPRTQRNRKKGNN